MQPGLWSRFRDWRRGRPFWGGLFTLLGGIEIAYLPLSPINELIAAGVAGAQSILVGFLIVVMGLFVWYSPANRMLAGLLTIIFSVSSLVLSNLGGLVVGMLAGIVGGALTVSWTDKPRRPRGRRATEDTEPPDVEPVERPDVERVERPDVERVERPDIERAGRPSPRPRSHGVSLRTARRRAGVLAVLVGLAVAASPPAVAAPDEPQPSPDCIAALAALPAELVDGLLPALQRLMPGLTAAMPDLRRLLPALPLLGLPAPPEPTEAEVRELREAAAHACELPQLLPAVPGSGPGTPLLPPLPVPSELLPGLGELPRLPQLPVPPSLVLPPLPELPLPGLPPLSGLPLPELPLPQLPLPELPLPGLPLPQLPLPGLPVPQLPRLPFPDLPGMPGLPGVELPPGDDAPPLPIERDPAEVQPVVTPDPGDVAPTSTSDLTMASLDVTQLVYQGIVELPTADGGTVKALRFEIAAIDADQLRIVVPTFTGRTVDLEHAPGNRVIGTAVTLDCTTFSLTALGTPMTFTVESPPPSLLAIPSMTATDVDIDLVTLKFRTLAVPTADARLSDPGTDPDPEPDTDPEPTPAPSP